MNRNEDEYADVDWDKLGFRLIETDYMYIMKCSEDDEFSHGQLNKYGSIELSPSAGVLNYAQVTTELSTQIIFIILYLPSICTTEFM